MVDRAIFKYIQFRSVLPVPGLRQRTSRKPLHAETLLRKAHLPEVPITKATHLPRVLPPSLLLQAHRLPALMIAKAHGPGQTLPAGLPLPLLRAESLVAQVRRRPVSEATIRRRGIRRGRHGRRPLRHGRRIGRTTLTAIRCAHSRRNRLGFQHRRARSAASRSGSSRRGSSADHRYGRSTVDGETSSLALCM